MPAGNADRLLRGRRAFVTGGATNIGRGIAAALLSAGAAVTIASRNEERLRRTAHELSQEVEDCAGVDVEVCDVSREHEVRGAVDRAARAPGRLDVVIANAGILHPGGFLDLSEQEWRAEMETNVVGTANTFAAAAEAMGTGGGVIVAISSHVAHSPAIGLPAYSCSKAAVDMMIRCAALEFGPLGIRVNGVRPGYVPQPDRVVPPAALAAAAESFDRTLTDNTLTGRLGTPADVAATVMHLVLPSGDWITGQSITVDGGASVHSVHDARELFTVLRGGPKQRDSNADA